MQAKAGSPTNGYDLDICDVVDRELKGSLLTDVELNYLNTHAAEWKSELIACKKRTEKQFTSSGARSFDLYRKMHDKEMTYTEYLHRLQKEKIWRVNAATFLQRIEAKLQTIKLDQHE